MLDRRAAVGAVHAGRGPYRPEGAGVRHPRRGRVGWHACQRSARHREHALGGGRRAPGAHVRRSPRGPPDGLEGEDAANRSSRWTKRIAELLEAWGRCGSERLLVTGLACFDRWHDASDTRRFGEPRRCEPHRDDVYYDNDASVVRDWCDFPIRITGAGAYKQTDYFDNADRWPLGRCAPPTARPQQRRRTGRETPRLDDCRRWIHAGTLAAALEVTRRPVRRSCPERADGR